MDNEATMKFISNAWQIVKKDGLDLISNYLQTNDKSPSLNHAQYIRIYTLTLTQASIQCMLQPKLRRRIHIQNTL